MATDLEMVKAIIGLALAEERGDVDAKRLWADQVLENPDGFYEGAIIVVRTLALQVAEAVSTTREAVLQSLLETIAEGEAGLFGGEPG